MTTEQTKPVVEVAPAVNFKARIANAPAPTPLPLDYAPSPTLTLEQQQALLAQELGSSAQAIEPSSPILPAQAKETPSVLKAQFSLFSCSAFILYLQGVPTAPTLQTMDSFLALTLDEAFTTLGLLTFRSRLGSGRGEQAQPNPALLQLMETLATVEGRLSFTSTLYQSTAREEHMQTVTYLSEACNLNLIMGSVANRKNATAKLEAWKEAIKGLLLAKQYSSPADYWVFNTEKRSKNLSPAEFAAAMADL